MAKEKTLREHLREAGRAKSPRKAAASRANGAKGGRPKTYKSDKLGNVTIPENDNGEEMEK